jgi:hypothetical protein
MKQIGRVEDMAQAVVCCGHECTLNSVRQLFNVSPVLIDAM